MPAEPSPKGAVGWVLEPAAADPQPQEPPPAQWTFPGRRAACIQGLVSAGRRARGLAKTRRPQWALVAQSSPWGLPRLVAHGTLCPGCFPPSEQGSRDLPCGLDAEMHSPPPGQPVPPDGW